MSEINLGSFANYRQMTTEVRDDLLKLQNFSEDLKLEQNAASIGEVLKKSADDAFDVAVIGEFKRGKSTLINALLEQEVLPADVMPATATLNRVTYSIQPFARIEYRTGETEDIAIDKLAEYVTKLTDESEQRAATVRMATVYYPTNYCKNNVDIIDTPGLNDDSTMAEVTLSVIPEIDAALFVIMAQSPFSEYERDFLENKLLSADLGRVLFVVTGIDRLDEDDVDRVLTSITDRINRYVIQKAKKLYGEDSAEFEIYKKKLGTPKVFGISAKQALKGKLKKDNDLLQRSRFIEFEKELERFLTEDRGAITLLVQVNKILSASYEIEKSVHLRISALSMGQQEFSEKYEEAKKKISEIRAHRDEEFEKVNVSADNAWRELRPQADAFWDAITQSAYDVIDNESITPDDIKKDRATATQERILKKVRKTSEDQGRLLSERIQVNVNSALGKEIDRLADFEGDFFASVSDIQQSFTIASGDNNPTDAKDLAIGSGIGFLIGGGLASGLYAGWKQGGGKGALIGGAVGLGSMVGIGLLAGALAIPFTWPVLIVASVVGAITGKFAVSKWVTGDAVEKYRKHLRAAIGEKYAEMARENDMNKTLRDQIDIAFNGLKGKIDSETETVLKDLESTLERLDKEIVQHQVLDEREKQELEKLLSEVDEIAGRADIHGKELATILEK
jgi:GTPase SAR1 family protein